MLGRGSDVMYGPDIHSELATGRKYVLDAGVEVILGYPGKCNTADLLLDWIQTV